MTVRRVIEILKNPYGVTINEKKDAMNMAAELIEQHIREKEYWRVRQHKRVY